MGDLPLLPQFDMYITVGNNATPSATSLNGLSFSVKMGILQRNKMTGQQQSPVNNFPGSTVVSDARKRARF